MPAEETIVQNEPKQPEKVLLRWSAPARPFKRRNREFYVTVLAIAAVVGLILFLAEGVMPVILIAALIFLFYVLNTVEPGNIEYQVTSRGLRIADKQTPWEVMNRFWFTRRLDSELLVIETSNLPGRIEMIIRPELKAEIKSSISEFLTFEQVPASNIDKFSSWFSQKMPGR